MNFCKFTNETRLAIEDASAHSGQHTSCAMNGTAAGGGYELALTAAHIMLVDDRRSAVSLPELPLLAVLPGTGGLTRLTDKRRVRRDLADMFCTTEEGVRGGRAVQWRLVDEVVPPSACEATVRPARRTRPRAPTARRSAWHRAPPLQRVFGEDDVQYSHVRVALDRARAAGRHHRARPAGGAARRARRHPCGGRMHSGRWRWRASWTTRCCICG